MKRKVGTTFSKTITYLCRFAYLDTQTKRTKRSVMYKVACWDLLKSTKLINRDKQRERERKRKERPIVKCV